MPFCFPTRGVPVAADLAANLLAEELPPCEAGGSSWLSERRNRTAVGLACCRERDAIRGALDQLVPAAAASKRPAHAIDARTTAAGDNPKAPRKPMRRRGEAWFHALIRLALGDFCAGGGTFRMPFPGEANCFSHGLDPKNLTDRPW